MPESDLDSPAFEGGESGQAQPWGERGDVKKWRGIGRDFEAARAPQRMDAALGNPGNLGNGKSGGKK